MKVLYHLQQAFRAVARALAVPVIWMFVPLKLLAWKSPWRWLRRLILEITSLFDFALVLATVQNNAMQLHHRVWRGNFPFGKALMVVDHAVALREIPQPTLRGNRFMGVDIVSNDSMAFVTNAGPITTSQPTRRLIRGYIDREIMTERVRALDLAGLRADCAEILREWSEDPKMHAWLRIRGAVTRLFIRILAERTIPKRQADEITFHYARRFVEFSLFGRYLPSMLGLLGTREGMRRDAYIPLRQLGVDNLTIDMTLFAAMFSVGTIVMKCVELARENNLDYARLAPHERMLFVIEAQRVNPTVTTVHRIAEAPERIRMLGVNVALDPGDEVAYPFVCINRDPARFTSPEAFRLDRSREEVEAVLSWSTGPHVCPAKDLSILVTVLMLDTLAAGTDLREVRTYNLEF